MAIINKKLIKYDSQAQFNKDLLPTGKNTIADTSIVFIQDTGRIYAHGKYYGGAWEDITDKPSTFAPSAHKHGSITNDGKIGTLDNRIIETTTGGLLTHVAKNTAYNRAFGTGKNQVAMGNHTHDYLPLSGGKLTGNLEISAGNTDKFIKFAYNTTDAYAWRIGYLGTGAGNENRLAFQSAKTSGASYVDALSFGLDDLVGKFAVTPTVGNTKVSLDGHTHNYDNYSSWTLEALNSANSSLGTAAVESGKTAQIKAGSGITLSMSGSQIVITNASPDQNHNTDEKVKYTLATDNQEYRMLMSQYYSTPPTILGVKYTDDIRINPHLARISATTFKGALDGKASTAGAADTATALTTKNVGSLSQPVFFDSEGKPKVLSRSFSTSASAYTYAERNSNGDLYARRFYGDLFGNSTSSNILNRRGDDRRGFTPANVSGGTALFTFSTQGAMNNQINDSDYSDVIAINSYSDASAGRVNALSFDKSSYRINHFMGTFGADSWLGFKTLAYTSDLVDTWNANTRTVDGYVTKGLNQANKVWKTDANGNPAWRNDENTTYSAGDYITIATGNKITGNYGLLTKALLDGGKDATYRVTTAAQMHAWLEGKNFSTESFVNNAIAGLEIGGRNYALKSGGIQNSSVQLYIPDSLKGQEVTLSFRLKLVNAVGGAQNRVGFETSNRNNLGGVDWYGVWHTLSGTPQSFNGIVKKTLRINSEFTGNYMRLTNYRHFAVGDVVELSDVKIEKGNKATDWSPAPEDQVSDWNESNTDSFSYLKNKPTTFTTLGLTDNAGSKTQPIYFSGGKPVAATAYANASVNYATSAGTATNTTNIDTLADNSSNAARFILFSNAATGNQRVKTDSGLKYNPSSNTITATLAGNASSATKVNNKLTLKFDSGTAENTSLYTYDGSAAKTIDIKAGSNVSMTKAANSITINATNTIYTHPTSDGNKHVPTTGTTNNGKVLKAGETAGFIYWGTLGYADVGAAPSSHTHSDMVTTGGTQTISGSKTFNNLYVSSGLKTISSQSKEYYFATDGTTQSVVDGLKYSRSSVTTVSSQIGLNRLYVETFGRLVSISGYFYSNAELTANSVLFRLPTNVPTPGHEVGSSMVGVTTGQRNAGVVVHILANSRDIKCFDRYLHAGSSYRVWVNISYISRTT